MLRPYKDLLFSPYSFLISTWLEVTISLFGTLNKSRQMRQCLRVRLIKLIFILLYRKTVGIAILMVKYVNLSPLEPLKLIFGFEMAYSGKMERALAGGKGTYLILPLTLNKSYVRISVSFSLKQIRTG